MKAGKGMFGESSCRGLQGLTGVGKGAAEGGCCPACCIQQLMGNDGLFSIQSAHLHCKGGGCLLGLERLLLVVVALAASYWVWSQSPKQNCWGSNRDRRSSGTLAHVNAVLRLVSVEMVCARTAEKAVGWQVRGWPLGSAKRAFLCIV